MPSHVQYLKWLVCPTVSLVIMYYNTNWKAKLFMVVFIWRFSSFCIDLITRFLCHPFELSWTVNNQEWDSVTLKCFLYKYLLTFCASRRADRCKKNPKKQTRMENLFHRKSSERALYHLCVPVRGCYCRNSCWLLLQALLLPSALGTRIYHPSTLSLSKQHAFWFLCMVKHTMFIASLC